MKTTIGVKILLVILTVVVIGSGVVAVVIPVASWLKCLLASFIGGIATVWWHLLIEYARMRITLYNDLEKVKNEQRKRNT